MPALQRMRETQLHVCPNAALPMRRLRSLYRHLRVWCRPFFVTKQSWTSSTLHRETRGSRGVTPDCTQTEKAYGYVIFSRHTR